ncbi:MAG: hypothetical protein ACUVWO_10850 [Thermodesulfobacteriota bacterium]
MTKKVFWKDSYLTELQTVVTSVKTTDITVTETIFFAFSGGQESDRGTIGDHPVLEVRAEGKERIEIYASENPYSKSMQR